ncbi:uncharacterized protein LOC113214465 [Frankliniella occidentalis]|uniref:Uncharacterized protein LOC113214465 n=1 Tax=Frankliniella occidentalis TaxID=133901 RepID=A0A6J1T7P7_FRAOC|nr:uncharacterized protein LOC113214465 [Frankliniella occidentalis]
MAQADHDAMFLFRLPDDVYIFPFHTTRSSLAAVTVFLRPFAIFLVSAMAGKKSSSNAPKTQAELNAERLIKCKFFLVFWLPLVGQDYGESDVLPGRHIQKKYRKFDALVPLTYTDEQKKKISHKAKVKEGADDAASLEEICLSAIDGHILTEYERVTNPNLIAAKKEHARRRRIVTKQMKENQRTEGINVLNATNVCHESVIPPAMVPQRTMSFEPRFGLVSYQDTIKLYANGVGHHVNQEALKFLEALIRTVEENVPRIPDSEWMCEVMKGLFNSFADKTLTQRKKISQLPDSWFVKTSTSEHDLFGNGSLYVPHTLATLLKCELHNESNWAIYTTKLLNNIYGTDLEHLTAVGTGNSIGIDKRLYTALYNYCRETFKEPGCLKMYNNHINMMISNKRKNNKRKQSALENGPNNKRLMETGEQPATTTVREQQATSDTTAQLGAGEDEESSILQRSKSLENGNFEDRIATFDKPLQMTDHTRADYSLAVPYTTAAEELGERLLRGSDSDCHQLQSPSLSTCSPGQPPSGSNKVYTPLLPQRLNHHPKLLQFEKNTPALDVDSPSCPPAPHYPSHTATSNSGMAPPSYQPGPHPNHAPGAISSNTQDYNCGMFFFKSYICKNILIFATNRSSNTSPPQQCSCSAAQLPTNAMGLHPLPAWYVNC